MIQINHLCDLPQHIDLVTDWIYQEFIAGIKHDISRDDVRKRYLLAGKDKLPITLLALDGSTCVGVASLVANDLAGSDKTPWLAGVYVDPGRRNEKIGRRLIEEIICLAGQLGFDTLYLRTEHAAGYYQRLGWTGLERLVDEYGQQTQVFARKLD